MLYKIIFTKTGKDKFVIPVKAKSRNYIKKWFRRVHGYKIISIKRM